MQSCDRWPPQSSQEGSEVVGIFVILGPVEAEFVLYTNDLDVRTIEGAGDLQKAGAVPCEILQGPSLHTSSIMLRCSIATNSRSIDASVLRIAAQRLAANVAMPHWRGGRVDTSAALAHVEPKGEGSSRHSQRSPQRASDGHGKRPYGARTLVHCVAPQALWSAPTPETTAAEDAGKTGRLGPCTGPDRPWQPAVLRG